MTNTRFYLSNNNHTSPVCSFDASWHSTGYADRKMAVVTKSNTAEFAKQFNETFSTYGYVLTRQYVSPALRPNQTLAGKISGQLYTLENKATNNLYGCLVVKVFDESGNYKSTLYSGVDGTEYSTTKTNRYFPYISNINSYVLTGSSGYYTSSGWVCLQSGVIGYQPITGCLGYVYMCVASGIVGWQPVTGCIGYNESGVCTGSGIINWIPISGCVNYQNVCTGSGIIGSRPITGCISGYWQPTNWVTDYQPKYRLVFEYGVKCENTTVNASGRHYFGDPTTYTDAPVNETDISASKNPWVSFDQNILFV